MTSNHGFNDGSGSPRRFPQRPDSDEWITSSSMNRRLQDTISAFLSGSPVADALETLLKTLEPDTDVFIVGGALRNLAMEVLHHASPPTEDIDIFLGNCDTLPSLSPVSVTALGGIEWRPRNCPLSFDICRLENFIILQKYQLAPSLENLLASIDFTMNTLVYDVRRKQLFDGGAIHDIERRLMEFNSRKLFSRPLTAYRILLLRLKTGFRLSSSVFHYIKHQVDIDTLMALKKILASRYDRNHRKALLLEYDRLCAFSDYEAYRTTSPEAIISIDNYGSR